MSDRDFSRHERVVLMRRWWLRPWKQVHILAGNLDAARWAIEQQGQQIRELREQQAREKR